MPRCYRYTTPAPILYTLSSCFFRPKIPERPKRPWGHHLHPRPNISPTLPAVSAWLLTYTYSSAGQFARRTTRTTLDTMNDSSAEPLWWTLFKADIYKTEEEEREWDAIHNPTPPEVEHKEKPRPRSAALNEDPEDWRGHAY